MKKIILIVVILLGILGYFGYTELYQKYFIVFEGRTLEKNVERKETKLLISSGSTLIGDITLNKGTIIFEDNSSLSGSIFLEKGEIFINDDVHINGNIDFSGRIEIGKNSIVDGNLRENADLFKDSTSFISGDKPDLFEITDYPDFLKYFDNIVESHKKEFGYIFLTSSNMDIRGNDMKPEEYFKEIYTYENNKLQKFDFSDEGKLKKIYIHSKKYINALPERKVGRFGVGFTTSGKEGFDKKHSDIYISQTSANYVLFFHEFGHVMDYAYGFIDSYEPVYPYIKKENSITEYGGFHKGEDFAEAYRYYVLHSRKFKKMSDNNNEIKQKYNYMKKYVFHNFEYKNYN